jgi:hypothetical protein
MMSGDAWQRGRLAAEAAVVSVIGAFAAIDFQAETGDTATSPHPFLTPKRVLGAV